MNPKDLLENNDLVVKGFDNSIIGIAKIIDDDGNVNRKVIYDIDLMVKEFLYNETDNDQELTYDEALEYLEYNVFNAYMGKNTPIYVWSNHEY